MIDWLRTNLDRNTSIYRILKTIYAIRKIPSLVVGATICSFVGARRYKLHLLQTLHNPKKRSQVDALFFRSVLDYWTKYEYQSEPDPDVREELKALVMGVTQVRVTRGQAL
jgi:hypothetical protein